MNSVGANVLGLIKNAFRLGRNKLKILKEGILLELFIVDSNLNSTTESVQDF